MPTGTGVDKEGLGARCGVVGNLKVAGVLEPARDSLISTGTDAIGPPAAVGVLVNPEAPAASDIANRDNRRIRVKVNPVSGACIYVVDTAAGVVGVDVNDGKGRPGRCEY